MGKTTGIRVRHHRKCPSRDGGACTKPCKPTFEASVQLRGPDRRKVRKTFPTVSAARVWRADATSALNRGTLAGPSKRTLADAAEQWFKGVEEGRVRTRSGRPYKPSVLRSYRQGFHDHVKPDLGARKLSDVHRNDLHDLADRLIAKGLDPSTARNAIAPVRCIYRRAVSRGEVAVNPTTGLELPAPQGKRDRIADPSEAAALVEALPVDDRAVWATAFYAGLRSGELQALGWEHVDLAAGVIRVERAYDPKEGVFVEPKSKAGRRTVPIPAVLRDHLVEHRMGQDGSEGLVFGRSTETPLDARALARRAATAWKRAKLERLTLHEARHTFASLMIAAGVNAKALSTYMGHSSIQITYDRYGHLMPGNEEEAAGLMDAFLERANTAARLAQVTA